MKWKKMSAKEELIKVKNAIESSQDKLKGYKSKRDELSIYRDDLLVKNALTGDQGKEIAHVDKEIIEIGKNIEDQERVIPALKKRLADFQRAEKLEEHISEAAIYESRRDEFKKLATTSLSISALKKAVQELDERVEKLKEVQVDCLSCSKELFDFMKNEKLNSLTDSLSREVLKKDRQEFQEKYDRIADTTNELIGLTEKMHDIQLTSFTMTMPSSEYNLVDPPAIIPEPEYSPCGRYMIKFDPQENVWVTSEKKRKPDDKGFGYIDYWQAISRSLHKPKFPNENGKKRKQVPMGRKHPFGFSHAVVNPSTENQFTIK